VNRARAGITIGVVAVAAAVATLVPNARKSASKPRLDLQLVYARTPLLNDTQAEELSEALGRAAASGYGGVVLNAKFGQLDRAGEAYFDRLRAIRTTCDSLGMEIIPSLLHAGYAIDILKQNRNLAAALPVRNVPFAVEGGRATHVADPAIHFVNGGFEHADGARAVGYNVQDSPDRRAMRDTKVRRTGEASLRLDGLAEAPHGMSRIMQAVRVNPFRCYRLTFWAKTRSLEPSHLFRVEVLGHNERRLMTFTPRMQPTEEWREVTVGFNSLEENEALIYIGVWGGRKGRVWIDDIRIEEVGMINVLRRPGTPVTVTSADGGITYEEGRDYRKVVDENLTWHLDHPDIAIDLMPESRIREGDRLRVTYFQGLALMNSQIAMCMSEPEAYALWQREIALVRKHLSPKRYFLGFDEVRQGGWCDACQARGMSAGEILGDCITRLTGMIRAEDSGADVFIWSDMLDPNHNANRSKFLFKGDFTGSWKRIPADLIIACWWFDKRTKSLRHFDGLGHPTLAAGYYDAPTPEAVADNVRGWLEALDRTRSGRGIMYTTWREQYDDLGIFSDAISDYMEK